MVDPKDIGTQFEPFTHTVKPEEVATFADAIGDENPAYRQADGDAFSYPPTYPTVFIMRGAGERLWRELDGIGVNLLRLLHSEQEYEYLGTIAPGDTITGQSTVADIRVRNMRGMILETVATETLYTNQHDEPVLREVLTILVQHEAEE